MRLISPPEQGQLVDVRSRRFVVTDIRRTSLPIDPLLNGLPQPQHLITLSSVEDDALGEELQVIWELEPGAQAFERMEFPELSGFDEPARLPFRSSGRNKCAINSGLSFASLTAMP